MDWNKTAGSSLAAVSGEAAAISGASSKTLYHVK
jgi:hypothetical protein